MGAALRDGKDATTNSRVVVVSHQGAVDSRVEMYPEVGDGRNATTLRVLGCTWKVLTMCGYYYILKCFIKNVINFLYVPVYVHVYVHV